MPKPESLKLCECGCGRVAPIAKRTFAKNGVKKGDQFRFIVGHSIRLRTGEDTPNWKGGELKIQCPQCGRFFYRKPSRIRDAKHNFCSHKCHGLWKSLNQNGKNNSNWSCGEEIVKCDQCGKPFKKNLNKIKKEKHNFCSQGCDSLWKSINWRGEKSPGWRGGKQKVICAQCGKEFEKTPARVNIGNNFCSQSCVGIWNSINQCGENHPGWMGGKRTIRKAYCPIWTDKEFKEYIFERDGHKCQNPGCWGTSKRLARHHVDFDKKNCKPNNIITICASCHARTQVDREWHIAYYQAIMAKKTQSRVVCYG